ncbi:PIN domain-containing protein [Oribacterium sp. P6A1]|uniref:PIN domain-containing protein n=1 Tax=Oribacterium sp. P6A1 TaxID=1410612 RepID=UPI00068C2E60|nr:PIN domain-containing protein [Oribacterium sp. P6A1]
MIILVDFENTHVSGLDGYEYLNDSDTLVMYYSDENSAVTKGMVTDLKKRNVHVSLVKLLKQHSNALDMYIASTTGMFLESGEKICIVSKDKGYAAVRDFWHSLRGAEILLGETIKECFLSSEKNDDERISLCKERAQKATLVDSFATMNTIPTRPTLSKANQRRRNRNIHFTEVSEPASLIPNPLMFETPADQLVKQMKEMPFGRVPEANYSESRFSQDKESSKTETSGETRREDRRRDGSKRQGDRDRNRQRRESEDSRHVNSRQDAVKTDSAASANPPKEVPKAEDKSSAKDYKETEKKVEKSDLKNPIVKSEPEKTAIIIRPEQKTAIAKSEPKYDPNRVQFVYDPVSRSMKKVGEASEEKKDQTAAAENNEVDSKDTLKAETTESGGKISEGAETENKDSSETPAASTGEVPENPVETVSSDINDLAEKAEKAVTDTAVTEEVKSEADHSEDAVSKSDDDKAGEKKTARKPGARKSASKRRTARKKASKEASAEESVVETTAADPETLTDTGEAGKTSKKVSAKDSPSDEKAASENAEEEGITAAEKKPKKKATARGKKADAASEESKTKKTRSGKKAKASESTGAETGDNKEQPRSSAVSPQEAIEKYGMTANTLHTYYVRLVKAYGKEEGRSVYDASKKAVQEEIKKRKAAEKAAEITVTE